MELKADIVDYMGKIGDGVLVLLSVMCDGDYSEATIYYTESDIVLTVDRSVEEKIGGAIESWEGYRSLLDSILRRLVPVADVMGRMDEVDFGTYLDYERDLLYVEEEEQVDTISGTHSNLA